MNDRKRNLLQQIRSLEEELRIFMEEQRAKATFSIEGKRIQFERVIKEEHARVRMSLLRWFRTSHPLNWLSIPVIYAMIVPLVSFDVSLSVYQFICFRLYRIPRVRRVEYFVIDRHHLGYLNWMEKFNCAYCGYANGVVAYGREIIGRTEQYWCPIKHAFKMRDPHERYAKFMEYGDASGYHAHLEGLRRALEEEGKAEAKL